MVRKRARQGAGVTLRGSNSLFAEGVPAMAMGLAVLLLSALLALGSSPSRAQTPSPVPMPGSEAEAIEALKEDVKRLRQAYEGRIRELEARISELETRQKAAEKAAKTKPPEPVATVKRAAAPKTPAIPPAPPASGGRGLIKGNAFNPAIGVIFNGRFTSFSRDPETYRIPGFPLGGESGPGPEGFALDETEFNFSSNVNDLFFASVTAALDAGDGGVEVDLEESFIQTIALPGGVIIKGGRFFAALGYLNENHDHTDNFADRPLPYQAFLADQYNDDGVQVSVVLPTDLYVQLGAGAFRGADFPAGGAANGGVGAYTGFLRLGGDMGFSHSWRFGLSILHADAKGRETGPEDAAPADLLSFDGNTDLFIADFKYTWAPNGNATERSFLLQGEYFRRWQDGAFNGVDYDGKDSGWYVEGVYKFARGWRVGSRFARLAPETNIPVALLGTDLDGLGRKAKSYSFMFDWARNDFSILRMQFSRDLSGLRADNRFYIQYIMAIGAHGAHTF